MLLAYVFFHYYPLFHLPYPKHPPCPLFLLSIFFLPFAASTSLPLSPQLISQSIPLALLSVPLLHHFFLPSISTISPIPLHLQFSFFSFLLFLFSISSISSLTSYPSVLFPSFWATAPKGTKSCRTQGDFHSCVHQFVSLLVCPPPGPLRPEICPLRP